jgi:hypothetical protein
MRSVHIPLEERIARALAEQNAKEDGLAHIRYAAAKASVKRNGPRPFRLKPRRRYASAR